MDLNVAVIGRTNSGKTTFLSNLSSNYQCCLTKKLQKDIKVQIKSKDSDEIYKFNFVDTVGFSQQKFVTWYEFDQLAKGIDFYIILVNFHKPKISTNQVLISQQSWQHAKFIISYIQSQWSVKSQKIMVIGNIFNNNDNQNQYLSTRQLQFQLSLKKIKYYEFNLIKKDQCQKVLQKLVENLSPSTYSNHFKVNTNFNVCLIGYLGSGKSTICAAMANKKVDSEPTTSNKIYTVQKNHMNSNFTVNLIDTPGLNFNQKKTLIYLSKLKEFDFHIYIVDLSDPKSISYLRMFFDLMNSWQKSQHTLLVIGNKIDSAKIDGRQIRSQLLEGIGQKYRFNYVETNALEEKDLTSLYLDYVIDIFSTYKMKQKLIQDKNKREIAQKLRRQQQYKIQLQYERQLAQRRQLQIQRLERQKQQEQKRRQRQRQQDAQRRRKQEEAKKNSVCQIM